MDQFLTYKKGNLGPVFNFTAYIYTYTHIDAHKVLLTIGLISCLKSHLSSI